MAWCEIPYNCQWDPIDSLIAAAAILIERGTQRLLKLNGVFVLDPVRCMINYFWLVEILLTWFRGCSAVSPNGKFLAVTNLYDGIDWYSLDSNHFMDASFHRSTPHAISENVILPVTFIHGGTAVLSGTSTGCARMTNLKDFSLAESLQHDCEWPQHCPMKVVCVWKLC